MENLWSRIAIYLELSIDAREEGSEEHLYSEKVDLIGQQSAIIYAIVLFNAGLFSFISWDHTSHQVLIFWFLSVLVLTLVRARLVYLYHHRDRVRDRSLWWGRAFTLGAGLSGVSWGVLAPLFFRSSSALEQLLIAFLVGGMSAGGTAVLAPLRGALLAYLLPLSLPLIFELFLIGDQSSIAMGLLCVVFAVSLIQSGLKANQTIDSALRLRLENRGLLSQIEEKSIELERKNQSLKLALEESNSVSEAKSRFLANMSHEIRTPMNGILGMTELLLDNELSATQRDQIETVHESAIALLAIINDVLDLSKIESGKIEINSVPYVLRDLIVESVSIFQVLFEKKGIELETSVDDELPKVLLGDSLRLRQVLINLLSNAIKFTPEGGFIKLSVLCKVNEDGSEKMEFSVRDTGIGIPHDKHSEIFEAFSQLENAPSRSFGGTGLGLPISAHLVNLMGGRLSLESSEGEGAHFFFELPLIAAPLNEG
ncbi:MAG: hypothetical protein KDD53_05005, partial [Bdellovibrionales bacterium]|nr:hypothetical protein [Bdellovibrionales bacterium]